MIEFLTPEGCDLIEIRRCEKEIYDDLFLDVKNVHKLVPRAESCSKGEMTVFDEQRPVTYDKKQCKVDVMIPKIKISQN